MVNNLAFKSLLKGRFLYLLISLLLIFFFYPFVQGSKVGSDIFDLFLLVILFSGAYAVSRNKKLLAVAIFFALTGVGTNVLDYFLHTVSLQVVTICCYGLFFIITAADILSYIMKVKKVTTDTIFGAICAYLLLGITWTMIFALIEILHPGSFLGGELVTTAANDILVTEPGVFIYYSFVTLTTLGYGDITPIKPAARLLSSLEAVTGQLYIAILIARLVALHIVHSGSKE
jgi:hypothetical protein